MEFEDKLEVCIDVMMEEFNITRKQADKIIQTLELYDIVFEYCEDAIIEAEKQQEEKWEKERKMNPDLF